MKIFQALLGKKNTEKVSLGNAIGKFRQAPSSWFTYREEKYVWPSSEDSARPIFPDNVRVVVDGFTLGHIERISVSGSTATIGHIATATDCAGMGLGPVLARAYAEELAAHLNVDRIVFSEDHSKYDAVGYPAFFAKIRATALPVDPTKTRADRPDYEWLKINW
jgi:hypothetical protein